MSTSCSRSPTISGRASSRAAISRPCHTEDTICFYLGDYIDDVLLEGTQLLYVGSDDTIRRAFSAEPKDNMLFLPGVMSRKKQIIPMLTALWG